VWNGYVNLTKLRSWKKLVVSEMKKPDRDIFDLNLALVFHGVCWQSMRYEKDIFSTLIVSI